MPYYITIVIISLRYYLCLRICVFSPRLSGGEVAQLNFPENTLRNIVCPPPSHDRGLLVTGPVWAEWSAECRSSAPEPFPCGFVNEILLSGSDSPITAVCRWSCRLMDIDRSIDRQFGRFFVGQSPILSRKPFCRRYISSVCVCLGHTLRGGTRNTTR